MGLRLGDIATFRFFPKKINFFQLLLNETFFRNFFLIFALTPGRELRGQCAKRKFRKKISPPFFGHFSSVFLDFGGVNALRKNGPYFFLKSHVILERFAKKKFEKFNWVGVSKTTITERFLIFEKKSKFSGYSFFNKKRYFEQLKTTKYL